MDIPTRKPSSTTIPEVNVTDISAEDKLLLFVEEQINKMRQYTLLGNGSPSFYELNSALAGYSSINCSYITLDVLAKEEYQKAKNAYDEFVAEKYIIIRNEHNPQSLSAQKWLSTQEINYYVQTDPRWSFEYKALRDEFNAAEKKVSFCRRLLDNLADFKYNIGILSKNIQAEVLNLNSGELLN